MLTRTFVMSLLGLSLALVGVAGARHKQGEAMSAAQNPMLVSKVQDKVGDAWMVQPQGDMLVVTRKVAQTPAPDMQQKLNKQVQSSQSAHKNWTTSTDADQVMIRGMSKDCSDAVVEVSDFSKIEGVNKIVLDLRCEK